MLLSLDQNCKAALVELCIVAIPESEITVEKVSAIDDSIWPTKARLLWQEKVFHTARKTGNHPMHVILLQKLFGPHQKHLEEFNDLRAAVTEHVASCWADSGSPKYIIPGAIVTKEQSTTPCYIPFDDCHTSHYASLNTEILMALLSQLKDNSGARLVAGEIITNEEGSMFFTYLAKAQVKYLLRFQQKDDTHNPRIIFKGALPFDVSLKQSDRLPPASTPGEWLCNICYWNSSGCSLGLDSLLHIAANISPNACIVDFTWVPEVDDEVLQALLDNCGASLKELKLERTNITDAGVAGIAAQCTSLKYLCLSECKKLTYRSYQAIYDGCPDLTHVDCFCSGWCEDVDIPDEVLEFEYTSKPQSDSVTKFGRWEQWVYAIQKFQDPNNDQGNAILFRYWQKAEEIRVLSSDWSNKTAYVFQQSFSPDGNCVLPLTTMEKIARDVRQEEENTRDWLEPTPKSGDLLLSIDGTEATMCKTREDFLALMGRDNRNRERHFRIRRILTNSWLRERNIRHEESAGCSLLRQRGICSGHCHGAGIYE